MACTGRDGDKVASVVAYLVARSTKQTYPKLSTALALADRRKAQRGSRERTCAKTSASTGISLHEVRESDCVVVCEVVEWLFRRK